MHSNASDCERRAQVNGVTILIGKSFVSRSAAGREGRPAGRRANGHFASSHVAWMWCSATSLSSPLNTVAVMYVGRLTAPVGRRSGVEQPQTRAGGGVPGMWLCPNTRTSVSGNWAAIRASRPAEAPVS